MITHSFVLLARGEEREERGGDKLVSIDPFVVLSRFQFKCEHVLESGWKMQKGTSWCTVLL